VLVCVDTGLTLFTLCRACYAACYNGATLSWNKYQRYFVLEEPGVVRRAQASYIKERRFSLNVRVLYVTAPPPNFSDS